MSFAFSTLHRIHDHGRPGKLLVDGLSHVKCPIFANPLVIRMMRKRQPEKCNMRLHKKMAKKKLREIGHGFASLYQTKRKTREKTTRKTTISFPKWSQQNKWSMTPLCVRRGTSQAAESNGSNRPACRCLHGPQT